MRMTCLPRVCPLSCARSSSSFTKSATEHVSSTLLCAFKNEHARKSKPISLNIGSFASSRKPASSAASASPASPPPPPSSSPPPRPAFEDVVAPPPPRASQRSLKLRATSRSAPFSFPPSHVTITPLTPYGIIAELPYWLGRMQPVPFVSHRSPRARRHTDVADAVRRHRRTRARARTAFLNHFPRFVRATPSPPRSKPP
mmetsp:Transcript_5570/g.18732  ORF Transcript_5570/g.18732 Transcript_5570/m.18732 type:complete len:200 (-) Transcript_5570:68-667(-)